MVDDRRRVRRESRPLRHDLDSCWRVTVSRGIELDPPARAERGAVEDSVLGEALPEYPCPHADKTAIREPIEWQRLPLFGPRLHSEIG
jgi:hypothetical protein